MSAKTTVIFDPSLFSGSADLFRTAYGGFYITEETDDGTVSSFSSANIISPVETNFTRVFFDIEQQMVADYSNLVPSFSFPVRVASNSEEIESDQEWRACMLGGPYGQKTYTTKISNTVHEKVNISYDMPYEQREVLYLENEGISDIIQISYDYSQHLVDYESKLSDFETELYIPNYYILSDLYRFKDESIDDTSKAYPSELLNFITFGQAYETPEAVFSFNDSSIPYSVPSSEISSFTEIRKMNTDLVNEYLVSPSFSAPTSTSTIDWVKAKQETILLDNEAITNLTDMEDYHNSLPYKIKITFPTKETGDFTNNFIENDFDSKILDALNETFIRKENISTTSKDYTKASEYKSGSTSDIIATIQETETQSYKEINYLEFLTYCRDQYKNTNSNVMFVGNNNIRRLSVLDENGIYRHINTKNSIPILSYAVDFLNDSTNFDANNLFSEELNYEETIAYRVEKFAGAGSGDHLTQKTLQNYWFLNSDSLNDFEFFDNQVKVDSDYTYNVYAYVLVAGIKYEYSDLLLTRDLGCADDTGFEYALEFYDPFGVQGNRQDRLFDDSGAVTTLTYDGIESSIFEFDDSAGGTYGSNAQIYSRNYKYLADFNISYEPFLKIIEVPISSKTLRILDNPPNRLNIVPYQVLDNSQRVGFDLYYEPFSQATFTSTISESDAEYKERYLNGKDLLTTTKITEESTSKQRVVEVYRLSTKPTSLGDFEGNLHKTISLKPDNQKVYRDTYTTCLSQIQTNKKYYYLFRALNEQGTPGQVSEIYETELINDGGYKFALFDTIPESELGDPPPPETSRQIKKIFQLRPKFEQIELDTTNVDFEQSADSQVSSLGIGTSENPIWDKTFKIRLTSKKTGKKLDLNITYKIGGE